MDNPLTEMLFCNSAQPTELSVTVWLSGDVTARIESTQRDDDATGMFKLSLGQAIQLRDFLNRHIDDLALKQTGSLAERSSDDPTQLAAEEPV